MANGADSTAVVTRVRYRERQPLRTADLTAEQSYLIAMRRRHNIGPHIWGIARGLQLTMRGRDLLVSPGFAIDGYGRELIVTAQVLVPESTLLKVGADSVDVWLRYGLADAESEQLGPWQCGTGFHDRTDEVASTVVTAAKQGLDPRLPPDVLSEDLNFSPDREPVDSPTQTWSVYLGRLQRPNAGSPFAVQAADRPWCALVGCTVKSPDGFGEMQVDGEIPEQPSRFAVSTANEEGTLAERLTIDRSGKVLITGDASVNNDLHIADAPVDESWGLGFKSAGPLPTAATPWQIYRAAIPVKDASPINQLRIEIGGPDKKADPKGFLATVCYSQGAVVNDGLSIFSDLAVKVSGVLKVEGQLVESPIPADASDPRFQAAVVNAWASGITAGTQAPLTATLAAQIGDLDQYVANIAANYSITVSNQGPGDVTNVHVYELLALNGQTVQPATDIEKQGFGLTVAATRTFQRTYTPSAAGEFVVAVTVIAVAPTALTTQTQVRRTFNIVVAPYQ